VNVGERALRVGRFVWFDHQRCPLVRPVRDGQRNLVLRVAEDPMEDRLSLLQLLGRIEPPLMADPVEPAR